MDRSSAKCDNTSELGVHLWIGIVSTKERLDKERVGMCETHNPSVREDS